MNNKETKSEFNTEPSIKNINTSTKVFLSVFIIITSIIMEYLGFIFLWDSAGIINNLLMIIPIVMIFGSLFFIAGEKDTLFWVSFISLLLYVIIISYNLIKGSTDFLGAIAIFSIPPLVVDILFGYLIMKKNKNKAFENTMIIISSFLLVFYFVFYLLYGFHYFG
ncbi:hypothetical protein ACAG96_05425 [Candidatus Izemoplasma sp. B36]|uniref:hypothetical protein n=1 Tax=Candidatus Izemoplasma sp. B36 TaxID=3242468 RepID=UPI0035585FC5